MFPHNSLLPAEASALFAIFGIDDPTKFTFYEDWVSALEARNARGYCKKNPKETDMKDIEPPTPGSLFVCKNGSLPLTGADSEHMTERNVSQV